jgi:pimeloyl-ACP methyl ester carboxylesterase
MARIEIGGTSIEYLDQGSGEPVLLLHCSGSSSAQWRSLAQRLAERYRVIAPDLYGYGGTAHWPGGRPFHLECEAEIVLALLARVGERAHLVGHSYGGAVALHLAAARGELLRSLTLIEPVAFYLLKGADAPALSEITKVGDNVARALASGDYVAGVRHFVDYWSGTQVQAQLPAEKSYATAARLPKIALDFHATLNYPGWLEDLRTLAVPTLLLSGTTSPLPTRRICELLAHALPHAELKAIAGAGHMAPITHRDPVNAIVTMHIDRYSRPGAGYAPGADTLFETDAARTAHAVA